MRDVWGFGDWKDMGYMDEGETVEFADRPRMLRCMCPSREEELEDCVRPEEHDDSPYVALEPERSCSDD